MRNRRNTRRAGTPARIGLIHLILKSYGIEPFARFVRSYLAHPAGVDHELILLLKGFGSVSEAEGHLSLLDGYRYTADFIPDRGFDIGSYFDAAKAFHCDYYCFLNSRSRILHPGWLGLLHSFASQPSVGVVGATGSCESLYSDFVNIHRFASSEASRLRRVVRRSWLNRVKHWYRYPPFPNHHIRTNAFMLRREVLAAVKHGRIRSRVDTSQFENGRRSLTRQLVAMSLEPLVVGKDGISYRNDSWHLSNTFWHGDQANLLVADNQTDIYNRATLEGKVEMARRAWGDLS